MMSNAQRYFSDRVIMTSRLPTLKCHHQILNNSQSDSPIGYVPPNLEQ